MRAMGLLAAALGGLLVAACAGGSPATRALQRAYPAVTDLDMSEARSFAAERGQTGAIRYTLSAPARVRLRFVDRDTPGAILRTLLDWAPRDMGPQTEWWDGQDRHGEPVDLQRYSVVLSTEPRAETLDADSRSALAALPHPEHKHFLHRPERCGDLEVRLQSPAPSLALSGTVTVTASLSGQLGMPDGEYHVVMYLDGRTAWDGRVPEPRVNRAWDTLNTTNGEHWLAVTFNDLHDHAGSDWVTVMVDNH